MKYFLDSAKIDEIRFAYDNYVIDGVTTNPRHVMLSGKPFLTVMGELADWAKEKGFESWRDFPISVEVNPHLEKAADMVAAAREISAVSPCFCIKNPCTPDGIAAAKQLEKEGIRTNLTLVFSESQALIAAKLGCLFVSPFIGWKEDSGEDCRPYIDNIVQIYQNYGYYGETQIICAAIRTGKQIADCAISGADITTAGLAVYENSFKHPFTTQGIGVFSNAWDNTAKE